jgi:hypothetical protein
MPSKKRPSHYHVAPRFTPGSPAMVNEKIAKQVAKEELEAYEEHVDKERYGEQLREFAVKLGLRGIVEYRVETKKGWEVTDLVVNDHFERFEVKAKDVRINDTIVEVRSGYYGGMKKSLWVRWIGGVKNGEYITFRETDRMLSGAELGLRRLDRVLIERPIKEEPAL